MPRRPPTFRPPRPRRRRGARRRGYDSTWEKKRAAQLEEEPWCRECYQQDRLVCATDVDHITPRRQFADPATADRPDNLQSLCATCHRRKTGLGR